MYAPLFKLNELPFRLSPDPAFLYLSKEHARAKAYMESTIWFSDGFAVITGEIGSGKTVLIETFLQELERDVLVAQISQTQISETEFLQTLLVQFGFQPFHMGKAELLAVINGFLIEQYSNGRRVLLIVDEAQNLSLKVLEEIRLLSGVETTKEKVLRIILAGQPELNDQLNRPELVQLVQRIRLRFHLTPLSAAELPAYIEHRLEVAGANGRRIFDPECYPIVYRYTGGTPRLINTLCDTAMLAAFGVRRDVVTVEDVQRSIAELNWVEHTGPAAAAPPPPAPGLASAPRPVIGRVLVAFHGETQFQQELVVGRLIIGRTRDNDLQIDNKYISRHHAQIISAQDSSVIEDLKSANGVYVNSKRVRRKTLNDGDVVQMGQYELIYIDERSVTSAPLANVSGAPAQRSPAREDSESDDPDASFHQETLRAAEIQNSVPARRRRK